MRKCVISVAIVAALVSGTASAEPAAPAETSANRAFNEDGDIGAYAPSVTRHAGTFHGQKIRYTTTAGRIPITGPDGSTDAQIFYVAYTKDGVPPGQRPIIFLSNGGPGAATAWMHMGGVGPRKILLNADGSVPPPPARLVDNPESALDRADLVFIDAPGTGFSRVANDQTKARLYTRDGDLQAYAAFIQTYLRSNNRFGSPLYLWGESYGSFRVAGLSDVLVRQGIPLKGVILLSSALDFHVTEPGMTNDLPYQLLLPSYASVAAFHGLLPGLKDDDAMRREVEDWSFNIYGPALAKGSKLTGEDRAKIVAGLARYTGLETSVIEMHNLRIEVPEFMKYLNASRKLVTGRVDGRLLGPAPEARVEEPFYDPAMGALTPAFSSATRQYLLEELRVDIPIPYRMYSRDVAVRFALAGPARYGQLGYPETLSALQSTFVKDRNFRILSMQGLYDLATPFASMEFSLDHMPVPQDYLSNIVHVRLPAGHMAYDDAAALKQMNQAVISFLDSAK
jgi:carboxypeptidase C (cathepsin A)